MGPRQVSISTSRVHTSSLSPPSPILAHSANPSPALESLAIKICQMVEAMVRYHDTPSGSLIAFQASIVFAALFLPKEQQYAMWARRKFAAIERSG